MELALNLVSRMCDAGKGRWKPPQSVLYTMSQFCKLGLLDHFSLET
jgi:hypothetical protein